MKNIFRFCFLFMEVICFAANDCKAYSDPTDYYRSKNSGNWNEVGSWQSSPDNISWSDANLIPTTIANSISIESGHVIDIISGVTLDNTVVAGTLRLLNNGLSSLVKGVITLNNGGHNELTINSDGIFQCIVTTETANDYTTFLYGTSGNINVLQGGKIMIGDGTNSHDATGYSGFASEPSGKVKWNDGAIFEWNTTGINFTSGSNFFPDALINERSIFRVSQVYPITNPGSGSTSPLAFNGILEVNTSFTLAGGGAKNFRDGIIGTSTLNLSSGNGTVTFTGATPILAGSNLKIITAKQLNLTSGITIPPGAMVKVSGTIGFLKGALGIFLVDGTLDITDLSISNTSGSVVVNGTLKTSKLTGLYNPGIISNGVLTLGTGSIIEYNSSSVLIPQDITGTTTLNQAYYHIVFSGAGTKNLLNLIDVNTSGSVTISGPDVIVDASTKNLGLTTANSTQFIMSSGRLILGTTGTQPNMDGAYSISGGTIEFANSGSVTQTIRSPRQYQHIEISGNNVNNSLGHILLNNNSEFKIKPGAVFTINDNSIKAAGATSGQKIIVENGGTLRTGNSGGFHGLDGSGNIHSSIHNNINFSNIILQPGSTVVYSRNGDQPITNVNSLEYSNLELAGTGNKIAPSNELTINGDFKKTTSSVFIHNNGTVVFNGGTYQNYHSVFPQMVFNNLTNNNTIGLNVNDSLSIYKELSLGANSKINLNNVVTLKSNISNTSNVAPIPSNATINYVGVGLFLVERYIPGHTKAWQLLSVPAKGSSIKNAWQEGASLPNENPHPGYGITITNNVSSTWQINGFDAFSAGGPSMKYYDAASNKYFGINSTNDPISNQPSYFVFVRGDRSVTAYNAPATATILRIKGKLFSPGTEAPTLLNVPANSFACIGNPYASAIDFDNLNVTDINSSYVIWDPQLTTQGSSAYGYGGFRTISGNISVPSSGNYVDNNIPSIQSGQAFFVQTTGLPGTILFEENSKVAGSRSIFREGNNLPTPEAQLRTNLYVLSNDSTDLIDGTLIQFHPNYSGMLDKWDARKIFNPSENMGILLQSKILSIERRPMPSVEDTLFYQLNQLYKKPYMLEFISTKWENTGLEAYLEDAYLKTKTLLNIHSPHRYTFSVNEDAGSQSKSRFHILLKKAEGSLPVLITNLYAYLQNGNVSVEWKTENEINILAYGVESSTDGIHFSRRENIKAINSGAYQWLDVQPAPGIHYYRLAISEQNGSINYSRIVKATMENEKPSFSIYPNPVINGIVTVQLRNQPAGNFLMRILNNTGQLINSKEIVHAGGNNNYEIPIKESTHGVYLLEITKPGGDVVSLKLYH